MPPAHRRAPILCSLCTRGLRPVATNMPPAARAQGQARCRLRGNSAARGNGCCASGTASCGRGNIAAAPQGGRPLRGLKGQARWYVVTFWRRICLQKAREPGDKIHDCSLRICRPLRGLKACRACGAGNFPNVQFAILKFEIRCRASCATNPHFCFSEISE